MPEPPSLLSTLGSRRFTKLAAVISTVLAILWFASARTQVLSRASKSLGIGKSRVQSGSTGGHDFHFWVELGATIAAGKPSFSEVGLRGEGPWLAFHRDGMQQERPDLVNATTEQIDELRRLHTVTTRKLDSLSARLPFRKGSRGIVTAAANDALTIVASSLRMLRKTGSILPVEIMIDTYEEYPCERIFPSLGARCIFVEDVVAEPIPEAFRFDHFAWKSAVVAFSSFEQVLFLDADLFPVDNPDGLFEQDPFKSNGYVLWPDYWASTTSSLFYEIARLRQPGMTERASTESGVMLINKASHAAAVLQSLFYNIYGPRHFYPLFSQGAIGFGDKETWLAAAEVHQLPFYQVSEMPARLGYRCKGKARPLASAQHHPVDDYMVSGAVTSAPLAAPPTPRILFVHGNLPKYDAPTVLDWNMPDLEWEDMLRCEPGGQPHRLWGSKEATLLRFGWDVEKALWDSMRWVACEHERDFSMWVNGTWHSKPRTEVCARVSQFYSELLPTETYDSTLSLPSRRRLGQGWSFFPN